jgi:multimeric flavodoxin WrbA
MQTNKSAIILNGSPRSHGNTAVIVQWLSDSLAKHDWHINLHNLYNLNIKGCSHCNKCKSIQETPGCVIRDDLIAILNQLAASDLIVIASPVYCWKVSGCMSATLDRFYSLFKDDHSLIKGKPVMGAFTSGGDHFEGMQLCVAMLKMLCNYGGAKYAGTIAAANCTLPEELKQREALRKEVSTLVEQVSKSNI